MRLCFACREVIREGESIVSDGNHYHPEHFCCDRCKQPVGLRFHVYKVWRLCHRCLPRPVCGSNQCSEPDRQLGQCSGPFYRLPVNTRLTAFHGCHSVRCSVCGRGIFCCGSPGDALVYHLSDGKVTCTRCYYSIDHFDRWLRMPGDMRGGPRLGYPKRPKPSFPDEFKASTSGVPAKVEYISSQPDHPAQFRVPGSDDGQTTSEPSTVSFELPNAGEAPGKSKSVSPVSDAGEAPEKSKSVPPISGEAPEKSKSVPPISGKAPEKSKSVPPISGKAPEKSRSVSPVSKAGKAAVKTASKPRTPPPRKPPPAASSKAAKQPKAKAKKAK